MRMLMGSLLIATSLLGCQSTTQFYEAPTIERPSSDLVLEPVEFSIIVQDDVVYYALTSEYYINLGINLLRVQQLIYDMATWEKARLESSKAQDDRDQSVKGEAE